MSSPSERPITLVGQFLLVKSSNFVYKFPTYQDIFHAKEGVLVFFSPTGWSYTYTDPFDLSGSIDPGAYKKLFC